MNAKLAAIANAAAKDLVDLIRTREQEILQAWRETEEEAELHESKPKFKLGFGITLDLKEDQMETALAFSIRRKVTCERPIPDPDQATLPLATA